MKNVLFGLILISSIPVLSQSTKKAEAFYIVSFNKANFKEISVEAMLPMVNDTLYMSRAMSEDLENGWAQYIKDLSATTPDQKKVELKSVGKCLWTVGGAKTIKLSYKVLIDHDSRQWKVSGAYARAYSTDSLVFFTGRIAFIAPRNSDNYLFNIQYNLPDEWSVSTAYAQTVKNENKFTIEGLTPLWSNGNMAGYLVKKNIQHNNINVEFAASQGSGKALELLAQSFGGIISEYDKIMGGSPKGKFAIFSTVGFNTIGGEAFRNSISMKLRSLPSMANKKMWSYLLAHEIFHLWNGSGKGLAAANFGEAEWFREGFTEYTALLVGQRKGLLTESEFFEHLGYRLSLLHSANSSISLIDAGQEKGKNYDLIYYGGMYLAMAIDLELIKATHGEKRFSDLLKAMYIRKDSFSNGYTYSDIIAAANEFKGADIGGLIERYTKKPGIVPVENYLEMIGLKAENSTLSRISQPNEQQKKYLKIFLE